ncbi:MAG: hypothetical protein R3282_03155 [Rhodothermales bacterium]|nr:hypothetical protein [Rhodothermales bacterium]
MEVGLLSLWLPTLLAAIAVFLAGFVLHMVLPHHHTDFAKIGDEERFSVEIRAHDLARGQYACPFAASPVDLKDPAFQERVAEGPVGIITIWPDEIGPSSGQLARHFLHVLVITIFVAYLTGTTVSAGMEYLKVFQVAGTAAFIGYAGAHPGESIWYHRSWPMTWKYVFDSLVYAGLTAGFFGWLWPGS